MRANYGERAQTKIEEQSSEQENKQGVRYRQLKRQREKMQEAQQQVASCCQYSVTEGQSCYYITIFKLTQYIVVPTHLLLYHFLMIIVL